MGTKNFTEKYYKDAIKEFTNHVTIIAYDDL